jgi:ABC-type ATPase involved in cell division
MATASTNGGEPIIRVEKLTARYGDRTVFDRVSFDVERGEVFVILGGSGCGKSTMLKHMIGQYKPASGRILIDGFDVAVAEGPDYLRITEKFGVMYQMGALFGSMTLIDNVRLPLEEFTDLPADAIEAVAASKLRMVGLAGRSAGRVSVLTRSLRSRASAIHRSSPGEPRRRRSSSAGSTADHQHRDRRGHLRRRFWLPVSNRGPAHVDKKPGIVATGCGGPARPLRQKVRRFSIANRPPGLMVSGLSGWGCSYSSASLLVGPFLNGGRVQR